MKKVLLVVLVALAVSLNAQIESGKLLLGGSLGINSNSGTSEVIASGTTTSVDDPASFSFSIMPQGAFMLTENIGVGLGIGFSSTKTTTPNVIVDNAGDQFDQIQRSSSFVIAPFARYYKNVTEKFYLFGELGLPIRTGKTKQLRQSTNDDGLGTEDDDSVNKTFNLGFNLSLGANYFIRENIALEASFGLFGINYNSGKSTFTDKDGKNGVIDKNSSFNFGFNTDNVFNTGAIAVGIKVFI